MQATTIAGDGRRRKSLRMCSPFRVYRQATPEFGRTSPGGRSPYASLTARHIDPKTLSSRQTHSPSAEGLDLGRTLHSHLHVDLKQLFVGPVPADEVPKVAAHLHFVREVEERERVAVPVRA